MKIIALGNDGAGDDAAALLAAQRVAAKLGNVDSVVAGRAGVDLLDLLNDDSMVILLDVVIGSGDPGHIIRLRFDELINNILNLPQVSSHGFGPAEVLKLGQALGKPLPTGCFIGIEGVQFAPGESLSEPVSAAMDKFVDCIERTIKELSFEESACMKPE